MKFASWRAAGTLVLSATLVAGLSGCSGAKTEPKPAENSAASSSASANASASPSTAESGDKTVNLVTYDSFALSKEAKAQFEKDSGYKLNIITSGDGSALTNKLVLTKAQPLGDVAYGMDNNTALTAVDAGVFADSGVKIADSAKAYNLQGADMLLPIDHSEICLNYDKAWFKDKGIPAPKTYEDLTKPAYKDLTVVEDPHNSTPGLAFLLGTIKHFGSDGWIKYWKDLKANQVKVAKGWSDAFNADFTAGENKSKTAADPIMVSYSSSPAWAVNKEETETTIGNVPETCYQQVEYAGLLKGAKHPEGAKKLLEFLTGPQGQGDLVANNYVYPTNNAVKIPEVLSKFGPSVPDAVKLNPAEVMKNREDWLRSWTEAIGG